MTSLDFITLFKSYSYFRRGLFKADYSKVYSIRNSEGDGKSPAMKSLCLCVCYRATLTPERGNRSPLVVLGEVHFQAI